MYFSSSCGSDSSEHGGDGAQKRRRCEEEGAGGGEVGPDSVHGDEADGMLPDAWPMSIGSESRCERS